MRALAVLIFLASTASARAERTVAASDDCAAPADAPAYVGEEVEAEDLNPWRETAKDVAPLIDRDVADHPRADRIFVRLSAHPRTGEALIAPAPACADRP